MSILDRPRMHFKGDFYTNVDTANNDDIVRVIDNVAVQINTTVNGMAMTDAQFIAWLQQPVAPGRGPRASWNYYGDSSCGFRNCQVVAIEKADGTILNAATSDPLIGAQVGLGTGAGGNAGIMVDLDAEGILGTQIFADEFNLRAANGTKVLRGQPTVAHSRWLFFGRNIQLGGFTGASAIWQSGIPKASLQGISTASAFLADLLAQAQQHLGLVVRYCTYLLAPQISNADLVTAFQQGQAVENPAVGKVIGTIGLWIDPELASAPADRLLLATGSLAWDHTNVGFGPAAGKVDSARKVVVLDLCSAFPEQGPDGDKVPVGKANLVLTPPGQAPRVLGEIDYSRTNFERTSGVVEVPYPADVEQLIDTSDLTILLEGVAQPVISEQRFSIATDDRNVYLEIGQTQAIELRCLDRGRAPAMGVTANLLQFLISNKASPDSPLPAASHIVQMPSAITFDGQGKASAPITGRAAGLCVIAVRTTSDSTALDATNDFFFNVRVFNKDDYDAVPDANVTFDFVYREVLRYYYILYPAMRNPANPNLFPLNDAAEVAAHAPQIRNRTDPANWHKWVYMPRTRELSAGKRKLLKRWLDLQK